MNPKTIPMCERAQWQAEDWAKSAVNTTGCGEH